MLDTQNTLYQQQLDLEASEVEAGKDRYMKLLTIKGHAETQVGRRVIAGYVDRYTLGIKEYLEASLSKNKRGRKAAEAVYMATIDPVSMAMIALRTVFQGASEGATITSISRSIGSLLIEHLHWQALKSEKKKLAKKVERQVAKVSTESHRRAVVRHVTHSYLPPELTVNWSEKDMIKVGLALLEIMESSTQLVSMPVVAKGKRKEKRLELTEFATKLLEDGHSRACVLKPVYSPMIVPPKPWTSTTEGGYLSRNQWLIKNRNMAYQTRIREDDLSDVFAAVNALQETAYCINHAVLDVAREALAANMQIAGLPDHEKVSIPGKPHDIETNEEALKDWKRRARMAHDEEAKRVSKQVSLERCVSIANTFKDREAIYFPHFLDWRGRAYCMPIELQPQGSDLAKALLKFAEGKPLGEDGLFWLKVHVANLFGVDKVSLVERTQWVDAHHTELNTCALFPLDSDLWLQADKPWQALAACFEYTGAMMLDNPAEYVSHLPIAMDGSCNGLQNLSAMLLDEEGGKATNLIPAEVPQDIYTLVMKRVEEKLVMIGTEWAERCAPHGLTVVDAVPVDTPEGHLANHWLSVGLNRKLVKRPVMTKPYGVTSFGMRDQMMGEMRKQSLVNEDEVFGMATWIAPIVEDSIGEIVVASKLVMDWLQDTAKAAAEHNLPLSWVTPVGLRVLQDYRKMDSNQEIIHIGGQQKKFRLSQHTDQVDKRKQANGMSPNVIHSMDASHMMLTILKGKEYGISAYSMVHDSYATHACNTSLLNAVLREAFVEMYSADILGGLREQFVSQVEPSVADGFPEVPPKGNLDLSQVMESDYFFA